MTVNSGKNALEKFALDPEFFDLLIDVEVKDVRHLNDVSRSLRVSRVVASVERVVGLGSRS